MRDVYAIQDAGETVDPNQLITTVERVLIGRRRQEFQDNIMNMVDGGSPRIQAGIVALQNAIDELSMAQQPLPKAARR